MNLERIRRLGTQVGAVLPFNLYNADGELILRRGHIVADTHQAERLHRLTLYRDLSEIPMTVEEIEEIAGHKIESLHKEEKKKRFFDFDEEELPQAGASQNDEPHYVEDAVVITEEPEIIEVIDDTNFHPTVGGAILNIHFDEEEQCPFDIIENVARQLKILLKAVYDQLTLPISAEECFFKISQEIVRSCTVDPDATIACILIDPEVTRRWGYTVKHSIDTAIVCAILAKSLKLSSIDTNLLLSAALSMNIGLFDIQNELNVQTTPLTDEQFKRIRKHPLESVQLLQKSGVTNIKWLKAVGQHHERIDGSGYPSGTDRSGLTLFAQLVSVADIYSAILTDRADRHAALPHLALKEMFLERGKNIHEKMAALLIRDLGFYPPGSAVRLESNEIAIVTRRAEEMNSNHLKAMAITNPEEMPVLPSLRDMREDEYKIKEVIDPNIVRSNVNKYLLWGYFQFNNL